MEFIFIAIIILFVLEYNKKVDTKRFIGETEPYFRFLMEDDYKFLLSIRYGALTDAEVNHKYSLRIRNGLVTILCLIFIFVMSNFSFVNILIAFIIGFLVFKMPYTQLKNYYKANLHHINQMLPYYLKGLEILIQHYTVPVALRKSIDTAPEIFRPGLINLVTKIEEGDSSVDPYMDFAKEYPVRDSMRMMRLLYRLSLGSQENKQEQLLAFGRNVSSLQNKSREYKYKQRQENMENRTMLMLAATGGGIMAIMLFAMMMLMNF